MEQCGGTVRWNSEVEQWNSVGGTAMVEQWWWNNVVEKKNSVG